MSLISELTAIATQVRERCALLLDEFHAPTASDLHGASIAELNLAYQQTLDVLHSLEVLDENTRGTLTLFVQDMDTEARAVMDRIKAAQATIKAQVLAHYTQRAKDHADVGIDARKLVPLGSFQIRNNLRVRVKDQAVIPDQYKTVNLAALKTALQKSNVPGTSFTVEPSVAYRANGERP